MDLQGWNKKTEITFDMGNDLKRLHATLYQRPRPREINEPDCGKNKDLFISVTDASRTLYVFSDGCYADDQLYAKDVTNDKVPELFFKSYRWAGSQGQSITLHIISLLKFKKWSGLEDISRYNFDNPKWVDVNGETYALAYENDLFFSINPDASGRNCGSCPRYSQIFAYRWDPASENFIITHAGRSLEIASDDYDYSRDFENLIQKIKQCPN